MVCLTLVNIDHSHADLSSHLEIWADRYPLVPEVKGSSLKIRAIHIIITSNFQHLAERP